MKQILIVEDDSFLNKMLAYNQYHQIAVLAVYYSW